jgi:ABC-type glycerol-3-phosphate transport system substrate-binding protein
MSTTQFLPASDTKLGELAQCFTQQTGIKVTIDYMTNPQLPAKLTTAVQLQTGHDLFDLRMHQPIFYEHQLVDLTDVVGPLAAQNGGMYGFCEEAALVKGRWRGFCGVMGPRP